MLRENETCKGIRELFKHSFLANCHLDGFDVTDQEIEAIHSISVSDILEGFKELILALLKFKKQQIESWTAAKKKMTVLENEAKNFWKIEKNLKELIEALQKKLKESEEKCERLEKMCRSGCEYNVDPGNFTLHKRYSSAAATGKDWNFDCEGFVSGLSESFYEIEKPRKVINSGILVLKEKLKEKSSEISKIQDKIREKIYSKDARIPSPTVPRLSTTPNEEFSRKNQENTCDFPYTRSSFSFNRNKCESRHKPKY